MNINFVKQVDSKNIIFIVNSKRMCDFVNQFDEKNQLTEIMETNNFSAKMGQVLYLPFFNEFKNIWIVGSYNAKNFIDLGASVVKSLLGKKIDDINIWAQDIQADDLKDFISGFCLRDYFYDAYKQKSDANTLFVKNISFVNVAVEKKELDGLIFEAESVKKVRNLVNCPPCDLFPLKMAENIVEWLSPLGVDVTILKGKQIEQMGLLNAVGRASVHEPCVVVMELNKSCSQKTALIGKGVTYDSGGLSLKGSSYMETMKSDMSGSAVVVGAMALAAYNKSSKGLVGIVGLVENMVSGNSYKPDDVVTSYSKKTVEIVNTDAEGRLVLADLISFAQDVYKVNEIVDLATLTGAVVVALGHGCAGIFSNNEDFEKSLVEAGKDRNEILWPMPMLDYLKESTASKIADLNHCAPAGFGANSSTAAMFLKEFVNDDVKWAHLDIAGVSFLKSEQFASTIGATGFGVRLLNKWLS